MVEFSITKWPVGYSLEILKGAPHQKLVGHILSNPELLEEK